MAAPGVYDIEVYKGDSFKAFRFRLYSDSEQTTPIDLSGCSCVMQVRKSGTSRTSLIEWTTDPASGEDPTIEIGGDDNNQITILERDSDTMDIEAGSYVYDIQVTFTDDSVTTYLRGKFTVTQDITN